MSEENISLYDLLNLSIGTPQLGAVNFGALHALLHAVLMQLGIREKKIRWRSSHPGDTHTDALDRHTAGERLQVEGGIEQDVQPATELQERIVSTSSPPPSSGTAADGQAKLLSRIQTCEDGVSKAMRLIQELHIQKDNLKDEMKELHHQQKRVGADAEPVTAVETCCHRVDVLEETVKSLRDTLEKYPDPEELNRCVTWDVLQSALLSERENLQKELVNSGVVDPATVIRPSHSPFSSNVTAVNTSSPPHDHTVRTAAPCSPESSGQTLSLQESTGTQPATETSSVLSGPPQQTHPKAGPVAAGVSLFRKANGSERYPETVEALRNISKLKEKFNKLEARVAALEEGKVDQTQLAQLRELITDKGSQDVSNNLMDQLKQQRALIDSLRSDREKNTELVNHVQESILQLRAECENLHETTRCLSEDSRQKQSHIEELYKTTEELEEKKADKQLVESEIKADKSALDSKVSRLQFDSATEQLSAMFHELLNKVTGQEQDWHNVIKKLSTEMECKLNRIELDSVKKQLEDCWKNIHEKLQAQGPPEHEDAAGIRKQLVDRFHCLSCDRPVVKHTPGPHLVTLPSTPGFPSHKSIRPFTVYALEQFRQHYRSERIAELTDYSHLAVSRSCGGSHTVTSPSQRRIGLQYMKYHPQPEGDAVIQSEEVGIVGLDGHIYRGRLNPSLRHPETKLPTISAKDGMCKIKDKARCSPSHKPAASLEVGHSAPVHQPHGAKSAQCSRSASSSSSRDWPVSALGCTSQSSITPPSAAAERPSEAQDAQQADL
ncbi:glutamine-rich protein 2 [Toxotes jaculatrix]|uniref:glutamine-rich protein 2 n=1 Tax=Toxotes jaculatrix TaxID=941984 RepID=UPI001B3A9E4D|nr:glutamine-rich protein 2 [Toxotes jaculatrix]